MEEKNKQAEATFKIIQAIAKQGGELRLDHLEAMSAAYYMKTDADPSQVELVEQMRAREDGGYEIVWFYRRRKSYRPRKKGTQNDTTV